MDKIIHRGYRIGGVQINVSAPEYEDSPKLAAFRNDVEDCDVSFDFRFKEHITPPKLPLLRADSGELRYSDGSISVRTLIDGDGGIMLKTEGDGKRFAVELDAAHPEYFGCHEVLLAMELPRLLLCRGAVFLHASVVKYGGRAILFTADKQVGKSTQAALWEKHMGAEIINGDRALIRKTDGVWAAYGSPFSGTSAICMNDTAPIANIVILGQAKKTEIRRATGAEALAALLSGISYDAELRDETEKCLELCDGIIGSVPFMRLDCTPDSTAVKALKDALTEI